MRRRIRDHGIDLHAPALAEFWAQRHLCTLTTLRPDGSPHVVPVGATLDVDAGLVRVIASRTSRKIVHVARAVEAGRDARVAICQVDGRYWTTVEGLGQVLDDPEAVGEAERRYAQRYRTPRENPERVVLAVGVERILGHL